VKNTPKKRSRARRGPAGQLDAAHCAGENTQTAEDANSKLAQSTRNWGGAKQLAARDAQVKEISLSLDQRKRDNSCEAKNVTLYGYAEEVLQRYKEEGVWASLSQKDPLFGLKSRCGKRGAGISAEVDAQKVKNP